MLPNNSLRLFKIRPFSLNLTSPQNVNFLLLNLTIKDDKITKDIITKIEYLLTATNKIVISKNSKKFEKIITKIPTIPIANKFASPVIFLIIFDEFIC